jgi:hypothetical protein
MGYCCRIFTPAQPVYPAASMRDFLSGAHTCLLLEFYSGATGTVHCPQNLKPGGFSKRHLGQMSANALVHWPQNFIPSGFSKAHFEQRMVSGVPFQAPRSSSSAFASFKSAVSKPSVNQP